VTLLTFMPSRVAKRAIKIRNKKGTKGTYRTHRGLGCPVPTDLSYRRRVYAICGFLPAK
jgi:hypothetical protein